MSHPRDPYQQHMAYHQMPQQTEHRRKNKRYPSNSTQKQQQQQQYKNYSRQYQSTNHQRQKRNIPPNKYPQQQYTKHSQQHSQYTTNKNHHSHKYAQHSFTKQNKATSSNHRVAPHPHPQLQSHHTDVYYHQQQPSLQYSQQRHQSQQQQSQLQQQEYYRLMAQYQQSQQGQQQKYEQSQAAKTAKRASSKKPARPSTNAQQTSKSKKRAVNKSKEKPLLTESCSLPEDDDVLRASVFLLEDEATANDGYSSDNTLFYGKINVSKSSLHSNKIHYLSKLGKEILTNNPKFRYINPKDRLAMKSSIATDLSKSITNSKNLYNAITKRLNEEDYQLDIVSDDSFEKIRRAEKDRKEVIRARQKMRRHKKQPKSYFFFFEYGSIGAVLCNLSASTLGCSVLCIPYVFSLCGWLYAFIVIAVIVLLQLLSMRLLLQCQKCTGVRSIQQLTILYLKNKCGVLFINIIIFGYCFTQCIAILIALADLIQPVFADHLSHSFLANRSFLLVIVTLFILLPLSFKDKPAHLQRFKLKQRRRRRERPRNMNRLRDTLYNICMISFLFAITLACMDRFCDDDSNENISFDSEGIHIGIYIDESQTLLSNFYSLSLGYPIILYALTTHCELFKVHEKLSSENRPKLNQIAHGALIQHTIYILILGSCGYFYFSNNPTVETNVVLNLKDKVDNLYILSAMIIIGIAMFLFYPTVLEPSRHSMSVLIFTNHPQQNTITQHILLTFFVSVFALIIALFIKDLAVLFAWSGAIFATILCLILPGLLFWNIIIFPSQTFVTAMMEYHHNNSSDVIAAAHLSKYNLNAQSTLNSIIATATPPLMNYARTVNDRNQSDVDNKSSLLSGSQLTNKIFNTNDGLLPNIMTPDSWNHVIIESHSRLYGTGSCKKSVLIAIDDEESASSSTFDAEMEEKYNISKLSDHSSKSASPTPDSRTPELDELVSSTGNKLHGVDGYSEYVSFSSHTKHKYNCNVEEESGVLGSYGSYEGGSLKRKKHKKSQSKERKSKWWGQSSKYHKLNKAKNDRMERSKSKNVDKNNKKREVSVVSVSQTFVSQSKTYNLREASKTIQEKVETQLKAEKMQRIKTLEKVNQSWTFWFDRIGAVLLLVSGFILFIIGNACNIMHIVDITTK